MIIIICMRGVAGLIGTCFAQEFWSALHKLDKASSSPMKYANMPNVKIYTVYTWSSISLFVDKLHKHYLSFHFSVDCVFVKWFLDLDGWLGVNWVWMLKLVEIHMLRFLLPKYFLSFQPLVDILGTLVPRERTTSNIEFESLQWLNIYTRTL